MYRLFILLLFFMISCNKSDFTLNLPRNNPLDKYYESNSPADDNYSPKLEFDEFIIVYDNNEDGIINKGETVYVKLSIKNAGKKIAHSVEVNLESNSSYINSLTPSTLNYGDILPDKSKDVIFSYAPGYKEYSFRFNTLKSTPDNEKINLILKMLDKQGNQFKDSFDIVVQKTNANLKYHDYKIVYDNNQDLIPNKGEAVYIKLNVENIGESKANKVVVSLKPISTYVNSVIPGSLDYKDILPNEIKEAHYSLAPNNSFYSFRFKIVNSTPDDESLSFGIKMIDESNNKWKDTFNIIVKKINANIKFLDYEIIYDDNNNKELNPGETVFIKLCIKNNGTSASDDISLDLSSQNSSVSFIQPSSLNYGNLQPNEEKCKTYSYAPNGQSYSFKIKMSENVNKGDKIYFILNAKNSNGDIWEDKYYIEVK